MEPGVGFLLFKVAIVLGVIAYMLMSNARIRRELREKREADQASESRPNT